MTIFIEIKNNSEAGELLDKIRDLNEKHSSPEEGKAITRFDSVVLTDGRQGFLVVITGYMSQLADIFAPLKIRDLPEIRSLIKEIFPPVRMVATRDFDAAAWVDVQPIDFQEAVSANLPDIPNLDELVGRNA